MNHQVILVLLMTFVITYIGTLSYAIRIVGVRTGKIAISFSLFNILVLVSRLASTLQVPLLTKYTEVGKYQQIANTFYMVLIIGLVATIAGAFSIPTFQRLMTAAVNKFAIDRSIPKMLVHGFSKAGVQHIRTSLSIPTTQMLKKLSLKELPYGVMLMNIIAVAILTVGTIAPIYSGVIAPDLRATSITLSGVINGFSTILLFVFVDPYLSIRTDDVIEGKMDEFAFRRMVIAMVGTKVIGAALAIPLLIPAAQIIVWVAKWM